MAELEFEEILPFVEGEGDTGRTAREKIKRNFDKLKPLGDVKDRVAIVEFNQKSVGVDAEDAIYSVIDGYYLTSTGPMENQQFSYSTPISLSKGDTILAKMCSGAALAIAVTDSQGTFYRLGVVGEDNLLAKEYKYTALEDCYVAICWRSQVSAPEYVKIVSNGTLTNVLNLYEDVSLSRKFTFDTNESVLSGQITFIRTISPTIKEGSKIKLTARAITGTWTRLIVYYNGDVQNHRIQDRIVSGEEYVVTLPEDAYSFGYFLTTEESVRFTIEIQELTDTDQLREDVNNRIDGVGGIIETLEDNTIGSTDRTVNILSNRGCFPVSTSATKNLGDIYSYTGASLIQIPVSEGDIIETNAEFDGSFGACTYDSNYQPLSSGTLTAPTTVVRGISSTPANHQITIESGEAYLVISDRDGTGYDGKSLWARKVTNSGSILNRLNRLEDSTPDFDFNDYCSREALYEQDLKNPFVWKKFDKAYFSWTNDDARIDMAEYQALCEQYGYPYCPAVPWESIRNNPLIGDIRLLDRLQTIINNGGEVLMHSGMGLTTESPFVSEDAKKQWYAYFRDSKNTAEKALNTRINVFIKAGVATDTPPLITETQKWCLQYYKMSDLLGNTPQYQLNRKRWTPNAEHDEDWCYQQYKDAIDDAVANHKWVRFYCHGTSEVSISLLTRVFDYIQTKINNGDAEFVTWSHMYETFKGSQLDKLINPNDY